MYNEPVYYNLIYEYFTLRFHFQYYRYGDMLPSVETLRRDFCVSAQTVKNTMKRLHAEGYITTDRLRYKVIFQQSPKERNDFIRGFLSERTAAMSDLIQSTTAIFSGMIIHGLRRMEKEDIKQLSVFADRMDADDIICFFYIILKKAGNPLALNLYWETAIFVGFSLFDCNRKHGFLNEILFRQELEKIVGYIQENDTVSAYNSIRRFQDELLKGISQYEKQHRTFAQTAAPRSFVWRLYHDRPQRCYSLALWFLHHIYMGDYQDVQYLPSYQKMAEITDTSVSTVRRTVSLLSRLGVVRPDNGKGIRIFSGNTLACTSDLSDSSVRNIMIYFFQAFELVTYSCRTVTLLTLEKLTAEEREKLIMDLETFSWAGLYENAFWCYLICITRHCPLAAVREVYRKIYCLFLLGHALKLSFVATDRTDAEIKSLSETMIKHLKNGDFHGFAESVAAFTQTELPITEKFMTASGFKPEELHPSQSIRLILSDRFIPNRDYLP